MFWIFFFGCSTVEEVLPWSSHFSGIINTLYKPKLKSWIIQFFLSTFCPSLGLQGLESRLRHKIIRSDIIRSYQKLGG